MSMSDNLYEIVQREDGRWIIVYGQQLPQAGMQWEGTKDYATEKAAEKAINGEGPPSSNFDRFLLDREPPAVEWPEEGKKKGMLSGLMKQQPRQQSAGGMPHITIMLILGGREGMLTSGMKKSNG
jgi:hypothetical protein